MDRKEKLEKLQKLRSSLERENLDIEDSKIADRQEFRLGRISKDILEARKKEAEQQIKLNKSEISEIGKEISDLEVILHVTGRSETALDIIEHQQEGFSAIIKQDQFLAEEYLRVEAVRQYEIGLTSQMLHYLTTNNRWAIIWQSKGYFSPELQTVNVNLHEFFISRFPVTVMDFEKFLVNGGYNDKQYWKLGWLVKEKYGWDSPLHWNQQKAHKKNPITGISLYEALAYAKWLSDATRESFTLLTEFEWERVAKGTEQKIYPWGNDFIVGMCNTLESNRGEVTAVDEFISYKESETGVSDLSGNVWEMCGSAYQAYSLYDYNGSFDQLVINGYPIVCRGGSFRRSFVNVRTTYRGVIQAYDRQIDVGFRLKKQR